MGLGVILYELLTGRRPFAGRKPDELKHQILRQTPPALRQLNPLVGADLEALCLRCLEKRASERPTAGELARGLRFLAKGEESHEGGKELSLDRQKLEYRDGLLKTTLTKAMASYSTVKKARRLMRARGLVSQKLSDQPLVVVAAYDTYMEVLIDAQLELENLAREVETTKVAFTKPGELVEALRSIESYLALIEEYETIRGLFHDNKPSEELSSLPRLNDFLRSARESNFMTMVIVPQRIVKQLIRDDLTHPLLPTALASEEKAT